MYNSYFGFLFEKPIKKKTEAQKMTKKKKMHIPSKRPRELDIIINSL